MQKKLIVLGTGQLGRLYGGAALAAGYAVTPVRRRTSWMDIDCPETTPIFCAVSESGFAAAMESLPAARRNHVVFLQNELFRSALADLGFQRPTMLIVWLSQKQGKATFVIRPSQTFGLHAGVVEEIHRAIDLPCEILPDETSIDAALVAKAAFILTINALGLKKNITIGEWLESGNRPDLEMLMEEAGRLTSARARADVDHDAVSETVLVAMSKMAAFPARGRTAQARIEAAVKAARSLQISATTLDAILSDVRGG